MKKYSALIILAFSLVFIILGYFAYTGYIKPLYDNNIGQKETINLAKKKSQIFYKKPDQGDVFSVEIEISGATRSNFGLEILDGNRAVHAAKIKGGNDVEFTYVNEWYNDSISFNFQTEAFEDGVLNIECRFLCL